MNSAGISDITSELGQLSKFVEICTKLPKGLYSRNELTKAVMTILGIGNQNSAGRFIAISVKFDLLENVEEIYRLSPLGRALVTLIKNHQKSIEETERDMLFTGVMHSPARDQLLTLLQSISSKGLLGKRAVMLDFFSAAYTKRVWRSTVINRNLRKLEGGHTSSFFQNKYGCLEHWLSDLRLVSVDEDYRLPTPYGSKALQNTKLLQAEPRFEVETMASVYGYLAKPFNLLEGKQPFLEYFRQGCTAFSGADGLIDFKALKIYVTMQLLRFGILLTTKAFDDAVKQLSVERVVDSVMLGKDGKPAYLTLGK